MYGQFIPALTENWRTAPTTGGKVEVSDQGRVRRHTADGPVLVPPHRYGLRHFGVRINRRHAHAHALVAAAVLDPRPPT
jgi:hypothetical protein